MFEGRLYKQSGYGARTIRFADADGGVATATYSYKLTDDERAAMARRITAALNFTRNLSIERLEARCLGRRKDGECLRECRPDALAKVGVRAANQHSK